MNERLFLADDELSIRNAKSPSRQLSKINFFRRKYQRILHADDVRNKAHPFLWKSAIWNNA